MVDPTLLALIHNAALLLTLALILDLSARGGPVGEELPAQALVGALIGAIGVAIMMTPWRLDHGVFFDTRSVLLAVSGLFFGAVPTLVAMAMTAALRLIQGGAGALTGVLVILASGAIGIAWRYRRRAPETLSALELFLFGLVVHAAMLGLMFTLPLATALEVIDRIGLSVLAIYPLATLLLATLMAARVRHRQMQAGLRESEERARVLAEQVPAILYRAALGPRSETLYISPQVTDLGFSPQEWLADPGLWARQIHPDDRDRVLAQIAAFRGDDCVLALDYRLATRAGDWRHFQDLGRILHDAQGRPLCLQGLMLDVTQARRDQAALALDARRTQALLALPEAAERLDERAFMQFGLDQAEALTGSRIGFVHFVNEDQESIELVAWSRATLEHYCTAAFDRHYPISQAGIWADALRQRAPVVFNDYQGAAQAEIGHHGLPEGHAELHRLISLPVLEGGLVRMLAGIGNKPDLYSDQDVETLQLIANEVWRIVCQRRTQAQLRKLAQAVEQSLESIVITDLEARIEYVNEAFVRTTGYSRAQAMGQNPRMLQSGRTPAATYAALWQALPRGESWQGQFVNKRRDGSEYTEYAIITPLRQPDGAISHYVAVKEDITERKRLGQELDAHRHHLEELVASRTQELSQAQIRAEAANLAKSAFLANMSHEIRTPMNAILGLTHLLGRSGVTPAQGERLKRIDGAARHLLAILNDILDLSKIEAGRLDLEATDFSLTSVFDQIRSLVAEQARAKGLTLEMAGDGVPQWLHGDPTRLRQALLNYVANAIKFTERGGIRVRARLLEEGPEGLLVGFEVKDTGIGIDADQLSRLFAAFEQADPSTTRRYGGSGLGLAITRRLAHLMGGEAGADSTPRVGSTFWFRARLGRGRAPLAGTPGAGAAATPLGTEAQLRRQHLGARLLLVEDNPINREVALEILNSAGLAVDAATDGRQALDLAAAGPYDLILMDIQMPVMNGLESTRAIRALPGYAQIPILAMTANAFDEDRQACLDAGMNDHVAKPVDPQALFATLMRWLPAQAGGQPQGADGLADQGPDPDLLLALETEIPGLTATQGLALVRGDPARYAGLLTQFADHHGEDGAHIAAALDSGDQTQAKALAHTLKGAAGTLGATAVQVAADRLMRAIRGGETAAEVGRFGTDLASALADLIGRIRRLPTPRAAPGAPDPARLAEVIGELRPLLRSADLEAIELTEAEAALLRTGLGEAGERLLARVADCDFEAALRLLDGLVDPNPGA